MKMARASSMFGMAAILLVVLISTCRASYKPSPFPKPWPARDISCRIVITDMLPCRRYLRASEPNPSRACCNGVKDINDMSKTRTDQIEVCKCIKHAMGNIDRPYNPNRIPLIPKRCGFSFTLPAISRYTDCNKVVPLGF